MKTNAINIPLIDDKGIINKGEEYKSPYDNASIFSSMFFLWLQPLLNLGSKRPLEFEDIYQLS